MQYASSLPFSGNVDKAFSLAESALTGIGFRITERTAASLEMVGPGMNSSRDSPLVGASRIHIRGGRGKIAVEADLGGVQRMSRFVTLFPLGLCLTLFILLALVFSALSGPENSIVNAATATGGIALLWLLLGPLISRWIRARTCRGLDALLANMVAVGKAAEPGE
jgi:hypothetical protein